ncbi:hypothetical protein [Hahella sp. HN01]|uniref:hypothetical protein n=1 Tax=Hahella sp. HN01 TaxID=2847262 RepID=UPI001C1EF4C2|nr:hypothetical protein [Hahella sp. HN01]MBU6953839.1 hypothetical protein [Hahella sp. HN01]
MKTTSDGIDIYEWETIVELASEIANMTAIDVDASLIERKLLLELDKLEEKYGPLPSILSTKAEYIDEFRLKLTLLKEAYINSCEISDLNNRAFISSTIAELYIDNCNDIVRSKYWLEKFRKDLERYPEDEYLNGLYQELSAKYRDL